MSILIGEKFNLELLGFQIQNHYIIQLLKTKIMNGLFKDGKFSLNNVFKGNKIIDIFRMVFIFQEKILLIKVHCLCYFRLIFLLCTLQLKLNLVLSERNQHSHDKFFVPVNLLYYDD